jgi:hypothetical protein
MDGKDIHVEGSHMYVFINTMLSGFLVIMTWNGLKCWMMEMASRYGG